MLAHKTYKNKIICQPQCLYRLGPEERQTEKRKQANGNNQQEQEPQAPPLLLLSPADCWPLPAFFRTSQRLTLVKPIPGPHYPF